eukprot:jgi/Mesvir1/19035/Mv12799-RA.2
MKLKVTFTHKERTPVNIELPQGRHVADFSVHDLHCMLERQWPGEGIKITHITDSLGRRLPKSEMVDVVVDDGAWITAHVEGYPSSASGSMATPSWARDAAVPQDAPFSYKDHPRGSDYDPEGGLFGSFTWARCMKLYALFLALVFVVAFTIIITPWGHTSSLTPAVRPIVHREDASMTAPRGAIRPGNAATRRGLGEGGEGGGEGDAVQGSSSQGGVGTGAGAGAGPGGGRRPRKNMQQRLNQRLEPRVGGDRPPPSRVEGTEARTSNAAVSTGVGSKAGAAAPASGDSDGRQVSLGGAAVTGANSHAPASLLHAARQRARGHVALLMRSHMERPQELPGGVQAVDEICDAQEVLHVKGVQHHLAATRGGKGETAPTVDVEVAGVRQLCCHNCTHLLLLPPTTATFGDYRAEFPFEVGASGSQVFIAVAPDGRRAYVKFVCIMGNGMKGGTSYRSLYVENARGCKSRIGGPDGSKAGAASHQLRKTLALQRIAEECGLDDLLTRAWAEHVYSATPHTGVIVDQVGVFTEVAEGVSLAQIGFQGLPRLTLIERKAILAKLNSSQIVRAAILDLLTSQTDRHPGNLFVATNGNIRLIDNDQAFGQPTGIEVDACHLPGTKRFETLREHGMLSVDYRCHVEGGKIGTNYPPRAETCLRKFADMGVCARGGYGCAGGQGSGLGVRAPGGRMNAHALGVRVSRVCARRFLGADGRV